MAKVITTSVGETFKVGPKVTKKPSKQGCYYVDGDHGDIPLVMGDDMGLPADMLKEIGKKS